MAAPSSIRYEKVTAKTLLSKRMNGDSWFHSNHSMNIYKGCQFACAYCDGMSEYYHVDNYTTHIRVKENAPDILRKELKKLGYINKPKSLFDYSDSLGVENRKPIIGVSGGVSDSYQQAEKEFKVTKKVLGVLLEHKLPAFLVTKSDLVLRDIELLKEINDAAHVNINFSIAFSDEEMKKRFEPLSPSISDRLATMKTLRESGIHVGVMGLPVIPTLADSLDSLRSLIKSVKNSKSEFILLGGMTLKSGRQKNYFYNTVNRFYPEKLSGIQQMYSNNSRFGEPKTNDGVNPFILGPALCEEQGIRWLSIRHSSPGEYVSNSLLLGLLLETVFLRSVMLREPKSRWDPYRSAAVRIEQGVPPIHEVLDDQKLILKYGLPDELVSEMRVMMKTGASPELEKLKQRVLSHSLRALETLS